MRAPRIFGIVNVTRDSFSDGGRWFTPAAALEHAQRLLAAGADVIDLGAESTHPDAEHVSAEQEVERLAPVVEALRVRGVEISVDTVKPAVMQRVLSMGVQWLNDVNGFRDREALAAAAAAPANVRFVVMHSRARGGRAERIAAPAAGLLADLRTFFAERVQAFAAVGIGRERLVFDPGMGFFLGSSPQPSLSVLRHLDALAAEFGPLLVSVSRKSFLGEVSGAAVAERGAATLAAELWAARHGAAFVRTHDVAALRQGLAVERAIVEAS